MSTNEELTGLSARRPHQPKHHALDCADRYARLLQEGVLVSETVQAESITQPFVDPFLTVFEFRKDLTQLSVRLTSDAFDVISDGTLPFIWPSGTIPFAYRPPVDTTVLAPLINNSFASHGFLALRTDGSIQLTPSVNWFALAQFRPGSIVYWV